MDSILYNLLSRVKSQYAAAAALELEASFYPFKNVSHTIRIRNKKILVRISDKLAAAPEEILTSIAIILFDKLFRKKTEAAIRQNYRSFVSEYILPGLSPVPRVVSSNYQAAGQFYDLSELFNKVNNYYFKGSIPMPRLGWSLNKSFHRLGFYDHDRNLLVISKIFDRRRVPDYVLEYLMYHEMLHIIHPLKMANGRRQIHTALFKKDELLFKEYKEAIKWLKGKFWRLGF